jgi:hypothetical protein
MPRLEINAIFVVLQCFLDCLEQGLGLILINPYVVADSQDDFADLLLLAVLAVLLVLVERDGNVDAGFGGPSGMDSKPV